MAMNLKYFFSFFICLSYFQGDSYFKITVLVINLEGSKAHWYRHLGSISDDKQNKILKKFKKL